MLIEINEGCNYATIISKQDGRKKEHTVKLKDLIEGIVASSDMKKVPTFSTALYKKVGNCRLIQSKYMGKKSAIHFLQVDKTIALTGLLDKIIGEIGYPRLIFAVKVVNNIPIKLYVSAIKDDVVTEDTKLYKYPYTNVTAESGSVCLGSNKFNQSIEGNDSLYNIPNLFFSMPNTLHSFSPSRNKYGYECKDLMLYCKDKEFEDELLMPNEKYITYKEWFEYIQ